MISRNSLGLLVVCLLAMCAALPASAAVKKPTNTYTLRIASFTATPKDPRLARVKGDFTAFTKQAPILHESGASFSLDISTPARFRKQMESASNQYDYFLLASGSVSCANKATCSISIPPSPDDLSKARLSGEWSLTVKDFSTVNLDIRELTLSLIPPGQTKPLAVQSVKTTRVLSLNRTYILNGVAKQKDKQTTLWVFAVCIVPGG